MICRLVAYVGRGAVGSVTPKPGADEQSDSLGEKQPKGNVRHISSEPYSPWLLRSPTSHFSYTCHLGMWPLQDSRGMIE